MEWYENIKTEDLPKVVEITEDFGGKDLTLEVHVISWHKYPGHQPIAYFGDGIYKFASDLIPVKQ